MADDRVFIKCKTCGGWKMLLKFYCGQGLTTRPGSGILEWLDTHAVCNSFVVNLGGDPGFTLHTEEDLGIALDWERQNARPPEVDDD